VDHAGDARVIIQDLKMGILVLDRHGWIVDHNKARTTCARCGR
jgi:hypothetical protein